MRRLFFYFLYAARNLRRGGRWTTFAIFSVAAGVATVVALRSLGLAIGDSLIDNVRLTNHGDVNISLVGRAGPGPFRFVGDNETRRYNTDQINNLQAWVTERGGQMSDYMQAGNIQIAGIEEETAGIVSIGFGNISFVSALFIDPSTYPPIGVIEAIDPAGVPIDQLFTAPNQVIISHNLAQNQNLHVGQQVRVSRTEAPFTVVGIVGTENEANLRDPFSAFFGFAYFTQDSLPTLGLEYRPNRIALTLGDNPPQEEVTEAGHQIQAMFRGSSITTTSRLLEQNQAIAQILGDFIVTLGLGALLIGGVGIMNTMLVMVRRRTNEIAALKTFGLKGRQVAMLFFAEAALIGLAGTVIGSGIGVLLGGLVNAFGETFINQPLIWRIYPEAIVYGITLGIIISVIFGVAPVLTAVKVRPGIILRPNETHIPKLGVLNSLFALIIVIVAIGLIVGQIVSPSFALVGGDDDSPSGRDPIIRCAPEAAQPVEITFENETTDRLIDVYAFDEDCVETLILTLQPGQSHTSDTYVTHGWFLRDQDTGVMIRFVVVDEVANRSISVTNGDIARLRPVAVDGFQPPSPYVVGIIGVAGTLLFLGILVGLLWMLVWIVGKFPSFGRVSLRLALRNLSTHRLRTATTLLALSAGMFALSSITYVGEGVREILQLQLQDFLGGNVLVIPLPGVLSNVQQVAVNRIMDNREGVRYRTEIEFGSLNITRVDGQPISDSLLSSGVLIRETNNPNLRSGTIIAGRDLTPADSGQPYIVMPYDDEAVAAGVQLGSIVTARLEDRQTIELEVVGFTSADDQFSSFGSFVVPPGVLPGSNDFSFIAYQVDEAHLNGVMVDLSAVIGLVSINIEVIDGLLKRLIDQFTSIPFVVGILSLLAAAVIMANTVALSTLERRRQIGILKAIGLKGRRVLWIMLLETTIVGLLSAIIGIGLSSIIVSLMTSLMGFTIPLPSDARLLTAGLVIAAIAIGWISTFLSAEVAIRERVMNVLRYE